jgi:two-component system, cell cycle response regulator
MRVLVADDDFFYRHIIGEALGRWGYEAVMASDGNMALQALQGIDPPGIAILNCMMPGMNGIEVCRKIRMRPQDPYIYIIMVTNQVGDVIEGLKTEADAMLIKPFDLQELQARVLEGQRIVDIQAAQSTTQQDLNYLATHDLLAGIWNRASILEIAGKEIARTEREGKPLCLALVGIDDFKILNEEFGYSAGERIFRDVAQRIQSVICINDEVGRYGDEEFLAIFPGLDEQQVIKHTEWLRRQIGETPFEVLKKQTFITISLGVARNSNAGGLQSLIHAADQALHRAKAHGRNRIEITGITNEYTKPLIPAYQCAKSAKVFA